MMDLRLLITQLVPTIVPSSLIKSNKNNLKLISV